MKTALTRYPLLSFFAMAFLFSWLAVSPLLFDPTLPVEPFQILGALAGPTVAAVLLIAMIDGKAGLWTFLKRYIQWRAGIVWWLIVLFGALVALTIVGSLIIGISVATEFVRNLGLVLSTYLMALVVGIILGPLWEEPGWRGFALPRLQAQFGPLAGTLILGVLWALWHIPGYLGGWMEASFPAVIVGSVASSVIMTWVYNNTRGSLLLMILFHSSTSAATSVGGLVLPANLPAGTNALVYGGWIPAITYTISALGVILFTRGRLSYKQAPGESVQMQPAPNPADIVPRTEPSPQHSLGGKE